MRRARKEWQDWRKKGEKGTRIHGKRRDVTTVIKILYRRVDRRKRTRVLKWSQLWVSEAGGVWNNDRGEEAADFGWNDLKMKVVTGLWWMMMGFSPGMCMPRPPHEALPPRPPHPPLHTHTHSPKAYRISLNVHSLMTICADMSVNSCHCWTGPGCTPVSLNVCNWLQTPPLHPDPPGTMTLKQ